MIFSFEQDSTPYIEGAEGQGGSHLLNVSMVSGGGENISSVGCVKSSVPVSPFLLCRLNLRDVYGRRGGKKSRPFMFDSEISK